MRELLINEAQLRVVGHSGPNVDAFVLKFPESDIAHFEKSALLTSALPALLTGFVAKPAAKQTWRLN